MSKLNVKGDDLMSFSQAVKGKLDTKQPNLTAGYGIAIDNDGTIRVTLDTTVAVVLPSLPTANEEAWNLYHEKLVLIPDSSSQEPNNVYIEYVISKTTVSDVVTYFWEKVGEQQLDLSNYYNKTETDAKLALKADKTDYFKVKSAVKAGVDLPDVSVDTTINPLVISASMATALKTLDILGGEFFYGIEEGYEGASVDNDWAVFIKSLVDILTKVGGSEIHNIFCKANINSISSILAITGKDETNPMEGSNRSWQITILNMYTVQNGDVELLGASFCMHETYDSSQTAQRFPVRVLKSSAPAQRISSTELQTIIAALS